MQHGEHLWVRLGQEVLDQGGFEVGTVEAVVFTPGLHRVTEVSVLAHDALASAHLVPVSDLDPRDSGLQLTGPATWPHGYERAGLPRRRPRRHRPGRDAGERPPGAHGWSDIAHGYDEVQEDLPTGGVAVAVRAHVETTDGGDGRVEGFLVDGDTGEATLALLRHGHLWGRRTIVLPMRLVTGVRGAALLVRVGAAELDRYAIDSRGGRPHVRPDGASRAGDGREGGA